MGVHNENNKVVIATKQKPFHFDLPKDVDKNCKYEIHFIIKHNKLSAEHAMKNNISQLSSKYKHVHNINKHRKQKNE